MRPGRASGRLDQQVPDGEQDEHDGEVVGDDGDEVDDADDAFQNDEDEDYLSHALFLPPPPIVLALQLGGNQSDPTVDKDGHR